MNRFITFLRKTGTVRGLQIFQLLRFASLFSVGIFLSKSYLTVREIGCYESFIFISGAISFFWVSGLLNALLSRYEQQRTGEKNSVLYNTSILIYVLNTFLIVLMFVFKDLLQGLMTAESIKYYPLLVIYVFLNNPTFLIEYLLLLEKKPLTLAGYGFVTLVLNILAVAGPIYAGYDLTYSFYAMIGLAVLRNVYLYILIKQFSLSTLEPGNWGEQVLTALPLIFSLLISGSADYIDGFLVSTHFGSDAFAIFRYGAKEFPLSLLLASAMSTALVPQIASSGIKKENLLQLKKESAKLMHLLYPLSIFLILTSKWFYPILFREEFISSAAIFNIYLLLIVSRLFFPQTIVMAMGKHDIIFKIAVLEIIVNVTSSYLLMQSYGIAGVAWGTVIAFAAEKILLFTYLNRWHGVRLRDFQQGNLWAIYSMLLIISYIITIKFIY